MMPEDNVDIRVRLRGATEAKHEADKVARGVDNIGDQADQTTRRLDRMNVSGAGAVRSLKNLGRESGNTRVSLGPFSTSLRLIPLIVGGAELALRRATPAVIGFAEGITTAAGGAGAAGGVGLLAFAQAGGVAALAAGNLEKALGGDATALKNLNPELLGVYDSLSAVKTQLGDIATSSITPGLTRGIDSALRNRGVLNGITRNTGRALGGLASDAGSMLGSKGFGRDLSTVGGANVKIITNLGHAGLFAADGLRHIAVEAAPLAVTLSKDIEQGARLADVWLKNARNSGEMSRFFGRARRDIHLLVDATGHTGRGIINLFGAQDVDGTRTLANLDHLTARFERWSKSPAVRRSVSDAIVAEIPKATGALMTGIANNLPIAGALGAKTFINGFMHADAWGKLLAGGFLAKKLGLFGLGKSLLFGRGGGGLGGGGGLLSKARPIPVWVVNEGGMPGKGGPGNFLKRAGGGLLGGDGLAVGGAAAGTLLGVGGALYGLNKLQDAIDGKQHRTAQQQRDAVSRQQAARLRAMGGHPSMPRLDGQGFPIPGTHGGPMPAQVTIRNDVRLITDGKELGRAARLAEAKIAARRGGMTAQTNRLLRSGY